VRGQHHAPAAPYPRERPGTHCTGGWVGIRAGLSITMHFYTGEVQNTVFHKDQFKIPYNFLST